jgi:predicted O-linked N-acetylglucosamine transferase (SPINDLY family)
MDPLTDLIGAARAELARENAERAYELLVQTIPAHPRSVPLLMAFAEVLTDLDRPAEALETYHRVLMFDPTHAEARRAIAEAKAAKDLLLDLAFKAEQFRAFDEARENYAAVIHQEPHTIQALTRLLIIDGFEGRLAEADRHHAMLVAALTSADLAAEEPELLATVAYQAIMRPLPPTLLAKVTTALDDKVTQIAAKIGPLPAPAPKRIGRLKIGYLSNHFRDHPIGHVTAALFAVHDRSRFEVHVFYVPTGEPNPYTEQIRAGAEHFHTASIGELAFVIAQQSLRRSRCSGWAMRAGAICGPLIG